MLQRTRSIPLLLVLALAGCADDLGPTSPELENSIFTMLGGLEVGHALTLSGPAADSIFLAGAPNGTEYLFVPFFASEAGESRLEVEVSGSNVQSGSSTASSTSALQGSSILSRQGNWRPDWDFHERFLERSMQELGPRISQLRSGPRASRSLSGGAGQAAVPAQVGAIVPLNTAASCAPSRQSIRQGRVEAVSQTAILVADTANPPGGMTREDYQSFGRQLDELVIPTLTRHFGSPTDLDSNNRVVVFFTRAVNEMTPPNSGSYIGGFFWAGDLFPRYLCPGSNEAEIFYQLAADPKGVVNGNVFPTDFVRHSTTGVLGHELQHLINASRRIYVNDAESFEAVWLDEGLSHIAEELLFYAASGRRPGQNLSLETLRSSQATVDAANAFMVDNLVRFSFYLERPEEESLLGIDNLETRGATWAFLRYASDHDPRSEEDFFRQLVNAQVSGTESLSRVLGVDAVDLMQAWTVSVFTDDYVPTADARFQQPSWNFRTIMPIFFQSRRFPLKVYSLQPDQQVQLRLRGGGAAFVRIRGVPGKPAAISTTAGGRTPPDRLRISVLRLR